MGKPGEIETIIETTQSGQDMLIYTLVVPLCFMLFMSVGMEKVWSLYLML
jgi:hypothetical protein